MTSLRRKITIPYICTIIVIPLLIMLLFNVAMQYFSSKQAVHDLQNITKRVERGLEFFKRNNVSTSKVGALIHARNISTSSELFLYTAEGESINPYSYAISLLNLDEIKKVITSPDSGNFLSFSRKLFSEDVAEGALHAGAGKNNGDIYVFFKQNKKYHAVKFTLPMQGATLTAIFISRGNSSYDFVRFANMILLAISILVICISIFISRYVVRSISCPIEYITSVVGKAEKDKFIILENNSTIKELKILSEKINEMSKNGYEYLQAQKTFFQNASHELRTPLANIQGYAEGLEHGIFTDTPKYSRIIGAEVKRLSNLVDGILSLSRIENESLYSSYIYVSASQFVEHRMQRMQSSYSKEGVEITFHTLSDGVIYINEDLFQQGFMNILYNASRYAEACICVTVSRQGESVRITISDDGHGISSQDKPYIFKKFYKGKGGHFGLGLAIAKSAIECMKGTVFLEESKKGATFVIVLPNFEV